MVKRFNKAKLMEDLAERAKYIRDIHGFTTDNGWAQVKGKGEDVNRAYGEWEAYMSILGHVRDGYIGV